VPKIISERCELVKLGHINRGGPSGFFLDTLYSSGFSSCSVVITSATEHWTDDPCLRPFELWQVKHPDARRLCYLWLTSMLR